MKGFESSAASITGLTEGTLARIPRISFRAVVLSRLRFT